MSDCDCWVASTCGIYLFMPYLKFIMGIQGTLNPLWLKMRFLNYKVHLMFIGPCIIVIVEEWKTNLMSLAILFHFLCAQHVPDINISVIRSLRLCCWITTSVVFFSVRCVLDLWCGTRSPTRNSWRTKDQLDVTCYFISLLMSSTCSGH